VSERRYGAVELLTAGHRVDDFDCGSKAETTWIRSLGLTAQNSGTSRVYVVRRLGDDRVVGFHALATGAVLALEEPRPVATRVGAYPISVIVLTRLGVDLSEQGQGLGRALLVDALQRVTAAADIVGVRALVVHAGNVRSRDFYLALAEFEPSPTDPLHRFLLINDLRRALI
jgi:GNAT superfamily N-acetyltransferase